MPASSRSSGSPRSGSRRSSASAARTFRLASGGSRRRTLATSGRSTTRRFATSGGPLLSEDLDQLVDAAPAAIQRTPISEDLRVEVRIGHDLKRRVEACGLIVTHDHRRRTPALRDRHALVPASDLVDQSTELRLRLRERKRSHDLTSLVTNSAPCKVPATALPTMQSSPAEHGQ